MRGSGNGGAPGKTPQQLLNDARQAGPRVHTPKPALTPGRSSRPFLPGQPAVPAPSTGPAAAPAQLQTPKRLFGTKGATVPNTKQDFARAVGLGQQGPSQGMSRGIGKGRTR